MTPPGESPIAFWVRRPNRTEVFARAGVMSGGMMGASPSAIRFADLFLDIGMMRHTFDVPGSSGIVTYSTGSGYSYHQQGVFCPMFAGRINEDEVLGTQSSDGSLPTTQLFNPWAPDGQWMDMLFGVPAAGMLSNVTSGGLGILGNRVTWDDTDWNVSVDEPAWGHGLVMYALWNPQIMWVDGDPSDTDGAVGQWLPDVNIYKPALVKQTSIAERYTVAQWPYGVDAGLWEPDWRFNTHRVTSKPCWILSNIVAKLPASATTIASTDPDGHGSLFFNSATGPCIAECALMWFMPEDGEHYDHHYYADWFDLAPVEVDAGATFFMGSPAFLDPNKWGHGLGETSHRQYAPQWLGSYFNNSEMTAFSTSYPYTTTGYVYPTRAFPGFTFASGGASSGSAAQGFPEWGYTAGSTPFGSTGDPFFAPHVKIDAEFRLPFIEFARPAIMDALAGGTVIEATAEVYFGDAARIQLNAEATFLPQVWNSLTDEERGAYSGDEIGWRIQQMGTETPGSVADTREEYVDVQRVYQTVQGDGTFDFRTDNTHTWVDEYMQDVLDTTGTAPEMNIVSGHYQYPPAYVPRETPWYPSTSGHARDPVVPLEGLRVHFALIGMQPHNQILGGSANEYAKRTTKEMDRTIVWHDGGNPFDDFEFTPSVDFDDSGDPADYPFEREYPWDGNPGRLTNHFTYACETEYLEFLRAQEEVPEDVGTLADYRYRILRLQESSPDPENGRNERVLADTWETVDLSAQFQAMVDDVPATRYNELGDEFTMRSTRYRICPCGPQTSVSSMYGQTGAPGAAYNSNLSALFGSMLPRIQFPTSTDPENPGVNTTDEFWRIRYSDILYQKFDTFQIRNIVAKILKPGGGTAIVRIRTPWDS